MGHVPPGPERQQVPSVRWTRLGSRLSGPQDFLDILFHSESSINHGGYSNPLVDSVLEDARIEPDAAQRVALYHEAERLIIEDAAWVPLWFTGERYVLIKPDIQDYRVTPMILPKLRQVHFK